VNPSLGASRRHPCLGFGFLRRSNTYFHVGVRESPTGVPHIRLSATKKVSWLQLQSKVLRLKLSSSRN